MKRQTFSVIAAGALLICLCLAGCQSKADEWNTSPSTPPVGKEDAAPTTTQPDEETRSPDQYSDSLPEELKEGQWVAKISNYRGSGEDRYLRAVFTRLHTLSIDLLEETPSKPISIERLLYSYSGDVSAFHGHLIIKLWLNLKGEHDEKLDDQTEVVYEIRYPDRGKIDHFTLSNPQLETDSAPETFLLPEIVFRKESTERTRIAQSAPHPPPDARSRRDPGDHGAKCPSSISEALCHQGKGSH